VTKEKVKKKEVERGKKGQGKIKEQPGKKKLNPYVME
jgi:hypothetical protein